MHTRVGERLRRSSGMEGERVPFLEGSRWGKEFAKKAGRTNRRRAKEHGRAPEVEGPYAGHPHPPTPHGVSSSERNKKDGRDKERRAGKEFY